MKQMPIVFASVRLAHRPRGAAVDPAEFSNRAGLAKTKPVDPARVSGFFAGWH